MHAAIAREWPVASRCYHATRRLRRVAADWNKPEWLASSPETPAMPAISVRMLAGNCVTAHAGAVPPRAVVNIRRIAVVGKTTMHLCGGSWGRRWLTVILLSSSALPLWRETSVHAARSLHTTTAGVPSSAWLSFPADDEDEPAFGRYTRPWLPVGFGRVDSRPNRIPTQALCAQPRGPDVAGRAHRKIPAASDENPEPHYTAAHK